MRCLVRKESKKEMAKVTSSNPIQYASFDLEGVLLANKVKSQELRFDVPRKKRRSKRSCHKITRLCGYLARLDQNLNLIS